jgi:hypothetical protein
MNRSNQRPVEPLIMRLSLLICAALNLDIAFRTQKFRSYPVPKSECVPRLQCAADDVSAYGPIEHYLRLGYFALANIYCTAALGITCPSAGRGFDYIGPHFPHLAVGRIFVPTRWNGCYFKAFDSQIAQLRLTRLPDLQTQFKKIALRQDRGGRNESQ